MSTRPNEKALQETMAEIEAQGLKEHLLELEVQGYTVLPAVLSEDQIERAKAGILRRVEKQTNKHIDLESATDQDYNGMQYQHYLLFDDPVFPEIVLEPKPLALMHYLLGRSCVLSSVGSHFRGPGGMPLALHADSPSVGMTEASLVANCNYALTPYSQEAGAIAVVPGSHRHNRQPTAHENWRAGNETYNHIAVKQLRPEELDVVDWREPRGAETLDLNPGDAVIWHGNLWHGGWRRDDPGVRMNLANYFCRTHMSTQEHRGDDRYPEVFERHADNPHFARLMGAKVFNGWRDEGPDLSGAKTAPTGLYD